MSVTGGHGPMDPLNAHVYETEENFERRCCQDDDPRTGLDYRGPVVPLPHIQGVAELKEMKVAPRFIHFVPQADDEEAAGMEMFVPIDAVQYIIGRYKKEEYFIGSYAHEGMQHYKIDKESYERIKESLEFCSEKVTLLK